MNSMLTTEVIELGDTEQARIKMRKRRDQILDRIDAAEQAEQTIPQDELRDLLGELFDLNIAIGDVTLKDGDDEPGQ